MVATEFEQFKDEVKDRSDIVEVIHAYVPLKRAGAKDARAGEVRQNDTFNFSEGRVREHKYDPFVRPADRGEVIGYYAIITWNDGGEYHAAMGVEELEEFSKTYSKSVQKNKTTPWTDSAHSRAWMCKKTALKGEDDLKIVLERRIVR